MFTKLKEPPPNTIIRVFKWINDCGDYYRDFDEINSNYYNPALYDGWDYIEQVSSSPIYNELYKKTDMLD